MIYIDTACVVARVLHGWHLSSPPTIPLVIAGVLQQLNGFVQRSGYGSRTRSASASVVIAFDGLATADVLERRRRDAYVRSVFAPAETGEGTRGDRDLDPFCLHPGTHFREELVACMSQQSPTWEIKDGCGSCIGTIARELAGADIHTDGTFWLVMHERDSDAITAMLPFPTCLDHVDGDMRQYGLITPLPHHEPPSAFDRRDGKDSVIMDVLTEGGRGGLREGGLVQDLPGLPRMPCTSSSNAMWGAYNMWRDLAGDRRLSLRVSGETHLDRDSLCEFLAGYIDIEHGEDDDSHASPEWSGNGWRARHRAVQFPHGFDGACAQYLDALDRELIHLGGGGDIQASRAYVHGCAPSATDLLNHMLSLPQHGAGHGLCPIIPSNREPVHAVTSWSADMQLAAIRPCPRPRHSPHLGVLSETSSPCGDLHTSLDLGCVHMFPSTFHIWWDRYPVIPALDFRLFEVAYETAIMRGQAVA